MIKRWECFGGIKKSSRGPARIQNLGDAGVKIKPAEDREYFVPLASDLLVADGDEIVAGTALAAGYLDPKEVLKVYKKEM